MLKVLKWFGIGLGSLIATSGIALAVAMHHPSPDAVCEHMSEVLAAQGKMNAAVTAAAFTPACIEDLKPPKYGKLPYAKRMRCLASADTAEALQVCNRR